MKDGTKENLQITGLALLSIAAIFGFIGAMDWAGLDGIKWFGFVVLTAAVFGSVAWVVDEELRTPRCLSVFVAMLVSHSAILIVYLRSVEVFPDKFFLLFGPLEAVIVGAALMLLGGANPDHFQHHRLRRKLPRRGNEGNKPGSQGHL